MDDSITSAAGPRKGCVDVFNEFMIEGATLAGYYKIPRIELTDAVPERLVPFSEAVSGRVAPSPGTWICFYEDDYKFEPFWREPRKYLELLGSFDGVIAPDYSLYADFTPSQLIWNTHRNYASGAWHQRLGFNVLANVRTEGCDSASYTIPPAPIHGTIAIGSHGCVKRRDNRSRFVTDLHMVCDLLEPKRIVVYGTDAYGSFDYPRSRGIDVRVIPSTLSERIGEAHER